MPKVARSVTAWLGAFPTDLNFFQTSADVFWNEESDGAIKSGIGRNFQGLGFSYQPIAILAPLGMCSWCMKPPRDLACCICVYFTTHGWSCRPIPLLSCKHLRVGVDHVDHVDHVPRWAE